MGSSIKSATVERPETDEGTVFVNRALLSIDYASELRLGVTTCVHPSNSRVAENVETHDYLAEGDVGFKKPKVGIILSHMRVY